MARYQTQIIVWRASTSRRGGDKCGELRHVAVALLAKRRRHAQTLPDFFTSAFCLLIFSEICFSGIYFGAMDRSSADLTQGSYLVASGGTHVVAGPLNFVPG